MSQQTSARHNYSKDSEDATNDQINLELFASYCCMAMWSFYSRDSTAMPGVVTMSQCLASYYKKRACRLMAYQNLRGGQTCLKPIDKPSKEEWSSVKEAFQDAINGAKKVNDGLINLVKIAEKNNDGHLSNFVEEKLMTEHVLKIKGLSDCLANLQLCGEGLGTWLFDRWLHKMSCKVAHKEDVLHDIHHDIYKHLPNPLFEP